MINCAIYISISTECCTRFVASQTHKFILKGTKIQNTTPWLRKERRHLHRIKRHHGLWNTLSADYLGKLLFCRIGHRLKVHSIEIKAGTNTSICWPICYYVTINNNQNPHTPIQPHCSIYVCSKQQQQQQNQVFGFAE